MRERVKSSTWMKVARQEALSAQGGRCLYCYEPLTVHSVTAEHRKARAKGGGDRAANIAASCVACNTLKGDMGEKAFLSAIKEPRPGAPVAFWLAWSRRRINLAAARACRNILRSVGRDVEL